MSTVTDRLNSIATALESAREQVSSTDFAGKTTLRLLGELLDVVRDVAAGETAYVTSKTLGVLTPEEVAKRRRDYVGTVIFQACKVPPGTSPEQREPLILHAMRTAKLTEAEIAEWQGKA